MEATMRGESRGVERVSLRRLLWVGPLAGLAAALVNGLVYLVASGLGAIPAGFVVQEGAAVNLGAVVVSSFMPALVGAVLLAILGRFTRRPIRTFRIVAGVALVLSFVTLFTLPGAPFALILVLVLMHVVAAVAITALLTTLARSR